jgi:two-component system, NtrC family, response regulator AtoC
MKRIFLIEDDPVYAGFLKKSLESSKSFNVQVYVNAEDCLKSLESEINPNYIIIDYFLPGMTGIEMYKKLRQQKVKAMAIMLSSNTDGSLVVDLVKQGIRNYVVKDENVIDSLNSIFEENPDKLIDIYSS